MEVEIVGQINIIAQIEARPETVDDVHALMDEYAAHVLSMDGSDRFEVRRDRDRTTRIVILEQYRDDHAFSEHIDDPENATLNDKLAALTDHGSDLQFLV
ncbi:MAG: putative quinol monooxygenase [Ancrocorticia sp.]|uniref:putative quinol monooxygenase n=1 Tax=Ancrocorticia sp. TaxID=2593684 RepID=UPI003F93CA4A